jgi:hypothetical protein
VITDDEIATTQRVIDSCVSTTEASEILHVGQSQVPRMHGLRSVQLPGERGQRLWIRADVERLAESRRTDGYELSLEQVVMLTGHNKKYVVALDVELQPIIVRHGQLETRRYRRDVVVRYLADRLDEQADHEIEIAKLPTGGRPPRPQIKVHDSRARIAEAVEIEKSRAADRVDRNRRNRP